MTNGTLKYLLFVVVDPSRMFERLRGSGIIMARIGACCRFERTLKWSRDVIVRVQEATF